MLAASTGKHSACTSIYTCKPTGIKQEVSTYEHNLEITSEGLRALIPDGTKPQCLGELVIVNGRISVGRLLSNHEVCNATVWRMHVIRIALTHLWAGSDVFKPMSMPIRFWYAGMYTIVSQITAIVFL